MSSVWSRVGLGSPTVVGLDALSAASRIADFTWALATGSWYVMPSSESEPSTMTGACPSVVSICAPICRSGSATRSIGRDESDSSPVSTYRPVWPATTPVTSRRSVPAFAQSAVPPRRPRRPTPCTVSSSSDTSSTCTPNARTASTVACVSPARRKPRTLVSPSPSAPSSTERWEIDLSPGTATCPLTSAAGSTRTTRSCGP